MSFAELQKIAQTADVSWEVLPSGEYLGKVVEVGTTPSAGGKRMWTIKFEVAEGPKAGAKVWNRITLSPENPNALAFFFKDMAALGITMEVLQHDPSDEQIAQMMTDRMVWLKVGIKPYQGTDRNEVLGMKAHQGGAPVSISASQVDPFRTPAPAANGGNAPVEPPF
jgi:hypothetical protein